MEATEIISLLKSRFEKNYSDKKSLDWNEFEKRLNKNKILRSLIQMEESGGEPELIYFDKSKNQFWIMDASVESPAGRRSLCYDDLALESRKENKPKGSALGMASKMGISLINEEEYFILQNHKRVDLKTSSWLLSPDQQRKKGGAIFGDCRYDRVFIYHNGAESYYAARGFRGIIKV